MVKKENEKNKFYQVGTVITIFVVMATLGLWAFQSDAYFHLEGTQDLKDATTPADPNYPCPPYCG